MIRIQAILINRQKLWKMKIETKKIHTQKCKIYKVKQIVNNKLKLKQMK